MAVSVVVVPVHIVTEGTETTGNGFTVRIVVVDPTQPSALVPVMV